MRLLITFARAYPLHSAIMLFALLLAGIAEGFGFSALLPLLNTAVRSRAGAGLSLSGPGAQPGSPAERIVEEALLVIGLKPTVEVLLVVIVLAIFLKSGLVLLANRRIGYTVSQVATDLRLSLLRAVLLTRWEYHVRQPIGGLVNAMATEAKRSSKACLSCVTIASLVIQTAIYVGVALLVSWKATLFCLSAGLALMYLLSRPIKKARRAGKRQTKLLKSLLGHMTDILQSIKPLKTMARENAARTIMVRRTKHLNKALRKQIFSKELLRAYQESVRAVLIAIGLYVALVHWNLPLTTVMVLTVLLVRILMQLGKVQQEYQQMVIFESAYDSIRETISEVEAEKEVVSGSRTPTLKKAIRLDRVSFAYSKASVLRNVSLSFQAGQITTIVGPSGSGKTTVADLVTGLLRPKQGEIWIDDVPMSEVDLRRWRSMIGYVPQDTLLLHDTVLVNVTLGDPGLNHDDGERALRAAGAWDFVKAMPQGMQSFVGERGANFPEVSGSVSPLPGHSFTSPLS